MSTITFMPDGITETYTDGENVFTVAGRAEVAVETACVGKGTCGLCRVRIVEGEEFLNPYTDAELDHLGNMYFLTKLRLSCRTQASGGDVVVELAPRRKGKRKRKRK